MAKADLGAEGATTQAAILIGHAPVTIWGMSGAERLRRSFERAGLARTEAAGPTLPELSSLILIRADWVFDQRLIVALTRAPDTVLRADDGTPVAAHVRGADAKQARRMIEDGGPQAPKGVRVCSPLELAGGYDNKLRKREVPFLMPLKAETLPRIRDRTFQGSYKGVTDFVTKLVWPRPAQMVTGWCANLGISPNQVTWTSLALVLVAFWLFWIGAYGAGLAAAWVMTFLDTVDGKLARVTMNFSKAGDALDHGIDLVHPPFWWWAWIVGLPASGHPLSHAGLALAIIVAGYVAQRIEEGTFLWRFGIEMHIWRPFDSWFRGVTARRNPNLVILTVASFAGRPDWGIAAVAGWTAICFFVHLAQIIQALYARRRGPITSWLAA